MSDAVKGNVLELVDKELRTVNEKFPHFASNHEACAVLLEEIEEAREELLQLETGMKNIWVGVKGNYAIEALHEQFTETHRRAVNLAVEAIQCAAMARKGILSNIEMTKIDEMEGGAYE